MVAALLAMMVAAAAYDADDPTADHRAMAIELDEAGREVEALASFQAAARFEPDNSANWYNLGVALSEFRGRRDDARAALERSLAMDADNTDAQEALDEIEPDPPTFSLKFKTVPLAEFEKDRSVYEEGRVPFVLRLDPAAPGAWRAFNWTLESLARQFPDDIVDHYPGAMFTPQSKPFLRRLADAARLFARDDPHRPKYIQWRMREGVWLDKVKRQLHPLPPFHGDETWVPRCVPNRTRDEWPRDNLFAHSRWRVVVVGNLGSGMFLHGDAFASAVWQAQALRARARARAAPQRALDA
eukprot:g4105.t1